MTTLRCIKCGLYYPVDETVKHDYPNCKIYCKACHEAISTEERK